MRKLQLLCTVATGLLLTAGTAGAQGMQNQQHQMPERAPAAQQNAPSEKMGPAIEHGQQKASGHEKSETTGQMRNESPTAGQETNENARSKSEGASKEGVSKQERNERSNRSGANKQQRERRGTTGQNVQEREGQGAAGRNMQERERQGPAGRNVQERERRGGTEEPGRTVGQGAAGGGAKLSREQRTQITTVFRQHHVANPVRINVPVRVGVRVPRSVHFYPVPTQVVTVYPEWRGYDYIFVSGRILIIDPNTYEIVAILPI